MMLHSEFPDGFLSHIASQPAVHTDAFRESQSTEAPVSIRYNPNKKATNTSEGQTIPWCSAGLYLPERPLFYLDPLWHAGAYYVQEASSMFLAYVLQQISLPAHCKALDLCAAPGGKSTLLADNLPAGSLLVSNEVIKTRVPMLCENMVRWGSTNVLVSSNQAIDFQRLPNYFDLIVADVPCSGSGLFRKDPTAKDEWSLEQVQQCAIRQEKIMTEVLPCLTENGILIYSTCSYSQEENEYMTDFLIRSFGMETVDIDIPTAWGIQKTVSSEGGIGFRFYPDQLTGEGFFICVLRLPKQVIGTNPMHRFPTKLNRMPEMDTEQVRPFLSNANNCTLYTKEEKIWMLPAELSQELDLLSQVLLLKLPGIEVGQMKGMHFVPAHALAMSGTYDQGTPVGALRLEDALRYLRKSDLPVDAFPDGWSLVSYADVILGWIKKIPHRINNYYPMGYRLRK